MKIEFFGESRAAPGRSRNGDTLRVAEGQQYWACAVADGVGGRPCDAEASALLCDTVLQQLKGERLLRAELEEGLATAFRKLYATKGACAGMAATLLLLAWDKETEQLYHFASGDSQLLVREQEVGVLQPLSTAASFEPGLFELPAMLRGYGPPRPGLAFALATDGLTDNRAGWRQELQLAMGQDSLQSAFNQLLALNRATQYDDLTLAIARFR